MKWQLLIEEFGPTIKYIKGPKNIVANALGRLDLIFLPSNFPIYCLDTDHLPGDAFPITYQLINCEQQQKIKLFL